MNELWDVQDAQNRLGEAIQAAIDSGPQIITIGGEAAAVLISFGHYRQLTASPNRLSEFFRASPLVNSGLDLGR